MWNTSEYVWVKPASFIPLNIFEHPPPSRGGVCLKFYEFPGWLAPLRWIPHNISEFKSEKLDKEVYSSNPCPLNDPWHPPPVHKQSAPVKDTPHTQEWTFGQSGRLQTVLGPSKVPGTLAEPDQDRVVRGKCVHNPSECDQRKVRAHLKWVSDDKVVQVNCVRPTRQNKEIKLYYGETTPQTPLAQKQTSCARSTRQTGCL